MCLGGGVTRSQVLWNYCTGKLQRRASSSTATSVAIIALVLQLATLRWGTVALYYVVLSCLALYCCLHGWSFRKEIWGHELSGLSRPRWTDWSAPLLRWQVIVPPLKKGRACGHCGEGGCNRQRMNKLQLCDSCLQTLQRPCSPRRDGRSFGHSAIAGPAACASVFSIQQRLCPTNDDPFAVAAATLASGFIPFSPIAI